MGAQLAVELSHVPIEDGNVVVLRDDLLDGGTKSRALKPFLAELLETGVEEVLYASPFCGFAQVALAYACRDLKARCRIFAERDPREGRLHAVSEDAKRAGASVTPYSCLLSAERAAEAWEEEAMTAWKAPLGLDCDGYRSHLRTSIADVWKSVCEREGQAPKRVWISLGSGTLSSELRTVLPPSVELCVVDVHVLERTDPRIERVRHLWNTRYFSASEIFSEPTRNDAPLPSNRFYDAKVWAFVKQHGKAGDFWWNIAR